PIALDDRSEPEPDVAVIRGAPRDYTHAHPARPALIVEVALSGLRIARGRKARAYARAGLPDYWIVNLIDEVLEVHRQPGATERHSAPLEPLHRDDVVAPLAATGARIRVAELLP